MRRAALSLGLLLATSTARADRIADPPTQAATDDQLVLLNASSWIGSVDQIARIRQVLDQRGLLAKLPQRLEATLDGRNALLQDLDAIKLAYGKQDYATAHKLIERDELRVLSGASGTDPMPALAQLSELSGLVAVAEDHPDEAVAWFRAAYPFNPAQSPEKQLTSPRVRAIIKKARIEPATTGKLRIDADPATATVQVDGGKLQPAGARLELPIGFHLVQIAAAGRKPHAVLVEIREGRLEKVAIALDQETQQDKAAKLAQRSSPPAQIRRSR